MKHQSDIAERPTGYVWAVVICALTTVLELPLRGLLAEANLALLYLLSVVFVTVRFGRGPGVAASVVAVLAFDIFLVRPYYSITVADSQYLLTFAIMLAVSFTVSHLTANLRHQALIARQREGRANALFDLSRELSGAQTEQQISDIGVRHLNATFGARVVFLLSDGHGGLKGVTGDAESVRLDASNLRIARLVFARKISGDLDEGMVTSAGIRYIPLRAPMQTRGVLIMISSSSLEILSSEQERLLRTCGAQIALAIERVHYAQAAQDAMVTIESERLRNTLLSAMSHDLRTPLTAIVGLSGAMANRDVHSVETAWEIAQSIHDQAVQMSNLVSNLLHMAKLQAGPVALNREWQLLEEVVGSALAQMARPLQSIRVDVILPPSLPLIEFDAVLLERVFCNLFDNAAKYSCPDGTLRVAAARVDHQIVVIVEDNGPGFPIGMEERVFAKFTRGSAEPSQPGVGLGLAICKAIIEAHWGTIHIENRPEGGGRVVFALPVGTGPSEVEVPEAGAAQSAQEAV